MHPLLIRVQFVYNNFVGVTTIYFTFFMSSPYNGVFVLNALFFTRRKIKFFFPLPSWLKRAGRYWVIDFVHKIITMFTVRVGWHIRISVRISRVFSQSIAVSFFTAHCRFFCPPFYETDKTFNLRPWKFSQRKFSRGGPGRLESKFTTPATHTLGWEAEFFYEVYCNQVYIRLTRLDPTSSQLLFIFSRQIKFHCAEKKL